MIEDEAAGDQSDDNPNNNSDSDFDSDEDGNGQLLDIESLRARDSELTDKQRSMLSKVEGIRRNLKKLLDKKFKLKNQEELEFDDTKVKGELKGLDKRALDLKEQLEKAENKLKTSLRGTSHKKKGKEEEDEAAVVERRKNSDDEEDEFFDRTKIS